MSNQVLLFIALPITPIYLPFPSHLYSLSHADSRGYRSAWPKGPPFHSFRGPYRSLSLTFSRPVPLSPSILPSIHSLHFIPPFSLSTLFPSTRRWRYILCLRGRNAEGGWAPLKDAPSFSLRIIPPIIPFLFPFPPVHISFDKFIIQSRLLFSFLFLGWNNYWGLLGYIYV